MDARRKGPSGEHCLAIAADSTDGVGSVELPSSKLIMTMHKHTCSRAFQRETVSYRQARGRAPPSVPTAISGDQEISCSDHELHDLGFGFEVCCSSYIHFVHVTTCHPGSN